MSSRQIHTGWTSHDTLGAVGIVAVAAVIAVVGVGPPIVQAMSREQLRDKLEETTAQTRTLAISTEKVNADRVTVERRLQESEVKLESLKHLNTRVMTVVQLAGDAGLSDAKVTHVPAVKVRQSIMVKMTITGTGGYPAVAQFFGRIHDKFPDIVVNGFTVDARRNDLRSVGAFSIELDWYAAPDSPSVPAGQATQAG
jgi:Tfp pilus assembly protein PilO